MTDETAIQKREVTALATKVDAMFGGGAYQIPIDAPLPQIKILRETPVFETPEGQTIKSFIAHIIYYHHANQYYDLPFGEESGGSPPKCTSADGVVPTSEDTMSDICKTCEMNQYESAPDGKGGKACQNTIRLYVLLAGEVIPCLVIAPPSSLSKKESLLKWLTNAPNVAAKAGVGTKYQPIQVEFSLNKKDFDSGFTASVLVLKTVKVLTPDKDMPELTQLASLWKQFMASYLGRIEQDVASEGGSKDEAEADEPTQSETVVTECEEQAIEDQAAGDGEAVSDDPDEVPI